MKAKSTSRMLPLQLPVKLYQRLEELGASEQLSVTQVARNILSEAVNFNDGQASLQEIYAVFSRGDSQTASLPAKQLRISVLKR